MPEVSFREWYNKYSRLLRGIGEAEAHRLYEQYAPGPPQIGPAEPFIVGNHKGHDIYCDPPDNMLFVTTVPSISGVYYPNLSSIRLAIDAALGPPEPELAETYRGYEIWTRWVAGKMDYVTPPPIDAAGSLAGVRGAIDRYVTPSEPEPEPQLVEVHRGYKIWTRPQFNDYTTPPPIDAAGNLAGVRAAIDRYLSAHPELVWTSKQIQMFLQSGLTQAEISTIPHETTDLIDAEFAVPKIGFGLNVPSVENIKRKVNDNLIAEGVDAEIVGVVYHKVGGRSWWDWYDGWKCWLFIRSPLAITGAITIGFALKIALAFFCAAVLVYWKWSEVRVAELKQENVNDINDVVNDILANPDLSTEQKQAIIDKLLDTHQKADEEGKSWVDKLMELAPIGALGIGLLLLLSFMPRKKG